MKDWSNMSGDEVLRSMSSLMAEARRSQLRIVGTHDEEYMRPLAEALARGVPVVAMPYLNDGEIVVAPEAVFMNEATRDRLAAKLSAARCEPGREP